MISFTPTYSTFPPTHSHTHPSPSPISSFTPNNKKPCITMFYLSFCKRNVLRAGSRDVNHPPSMILPEKAHRKQGSEGGGGEIRESPRLSAHSLVLNQLTVQQQSLPLSGVQSYFLFLSGSFDFCSDLPISFRFRWNLLPESKNIRPSLNGGFDAQ